MTTPVPRPRPRNGRASPRAGAGFALVVLALALMWVIEAVDSLVLDDRLQTNGIHPREGEGLDGILWAPFLHSDLGHLASNSVPLVVLGGLVAVRGLRQWAWVTGLVLVIGGGLTWALARDGNHIGASGVVFGYFGAIVGFALFERRPRALAAALLAIFLYSGIVMGIVPQDGISWEGHLFGLIAGLAAARGLTPARNRRAPA